MRQAPRAGVLAASALKFDELVEAETNRHVLSN
jgi:hypothetical protein